MQTALITAEAAPLAGFRPLQDGPTLDEVIPGIGDSIEIDPAIIQALPPGCSFSRATAYGASLWTRTAKVITTAPDGSEGNFFLKMAAGELGRQMFRGEFEGMTAIYKTAPTFAPEPIAWGSCRDATGVYFFLSDFIDMADGDLPEPAAFCSQLATLHRNSVSPTGKFGFHVPTCNGNIPQRNGWWDSWEAFFADGLRCMMQLDVEVNGAQPELVEAMGPVFERVIPRLLRPLEQGPNPIRPALVHGDLWYGNSSTNLNTDAPVVFDSAAFYAHNEYELGNWRPVRNRFNKAYFRAYAKHYPIAHPEAEFDDRIMLYELRFNFHLCIMFPGSVTAKREMINSMRYLANKYSSAELT
ncbi:fructosamine kinase [Purpureocillium lilacinum]|uniref:protein-ribulosamine 3-kinase n=1 Tax=Purpureocillium lilacinum TaxID=33203 RepID=A0A179G306_PURLI|nr:fructosamine kinase [Purpureocillium lilacinum]